MPCLYCLSRPLLLRQSERGLSSPEVGEGAQYAGEAPFNFAGSAVAGGWGRGVFSACEWGAGVGVSGDRAGRPGVGGAVA